MIVVTNGDEKCTKATTVAVANCQKDLEQILVREVGWKRRDCISEDEGLDPGVGRPWRWSNDQEWARFKTLHLVRCSRVRLNVTFTQLAHDGDSNLGVQGHLVPQLNELQTLGQLDWVRLSEKPRVKVPEALGGLDGVEANVVNGLTGGSPLDGVDHHEHLEVEIRLVGLENETQNILDLALNLSLPLAVVQRRRETRQPGDVEPGLVVAVPDPVVEFGVLRSLEIHSMIQEHVILLEIRNSVDIGANRVSN